MLCQVFHLNAMEITQSTMQGDIGKVYAADLHAFHQLTTEMQACSRGGHCPLVLGEDTLEVLHVLWSTMMVLTAVDDIAWKRCLT